MELIIQILILFIIVNTLLKLSLWRTWWQPALFGVICGAFVIIACQWAILQSKTQLSDYLGNPTVMQDMAVLITIESVLCFSYCFLALRGDEDKKKKKTIKLFKWYPSLLIFPVLFYLLTQLIFALPGIPFASTSYVMAAAISIGIPLVSYGLKWFFNERDFRLEVHFLVSLFVAIIGLITTVNGNVTYAAAKEPINGKAIVLSALLFAGMFLIGMYWNKCKWILYSNKNIKK